MAAAMNARSPPEKLRWGNWKVCFVRSIALGEQKTRGFLVRHRSDTANDPVGDNQPVPPETDHVTHADLCEIRLANKNKISRAYPGNHAATRYSQIHRALRAHFIGNQKGEIGVR